MFKNIKFYKYCWLFIVFFLIQGASKLLGQTFRRDKTHIDKHKSSYNELSPESKIQSVCKRLFFKFSKIKHTLYNIYFNGLFCDFSCTLQIKIFLFKQLVFLY